MTRALVGEGVGTFCLVFAGTGAIACDAAFGGALGQVGISLAFGLVVMAMIYTYGDVSGAHLNPAVTIAFAASGRFAWSRVPAYAGVQVGGAILGSLLVLAIFGRGVTLGQTLPAEVHAGPLRALAIETVTTFVLMLTIFGVATGAKEKGLMAGIAIGGAVTLGALIGGPLSGGSMNPARSIGPALASGEFGSLWVYVLGPCAGALLAIPAAWASRHPPERVPGASST